MARHLSGKEVNASLHAEITEKVLSLKSKGVFPQLRLIRVGENPGDLSYERGTARRCEELGVVMTKTILPENVSQEELLLAIQEANQDKNVHGILLFRPLPPHLDAALIENAVLPEKDVDGMTDASLGGVFTGKRIGFPPCTPQACMAILDHYGIEVQGKRAVVIGRSLVAGKPAAMMLLKKNATVTICHTRTKDMSAIAREADILLVAAGKAGVAKEGFFREGQTVIDVGININAEGKLCGDIDSASAEICEAYTPVPGGVGAVTTTILLSHVVEAAENALAWQEA